MKNLLCSLMFLMTFSGPGLLAQNYDSDSVYYTNFNKPVVSPARYTPPPAFRDTVKQSPYVDYYFQINSGAAMGCSNCKTGREYSFSLSTIHGVTIGRKLRVGGGAAFDAYYNWQTLPLFGNLSFDLIGSRNTHAVFVQAQYGAAFGWYRPGIEEYGLKKDNGGRYMAAQLGYRISYYKLRIVILAGFKQQKVSTYYEYPNYIGSSAPPNTMTNNREMQRFTLSLGVGLK